MWHNYVWVRRRTQDVGVRRKACGSWWGSSGNCCNLKAQGSACCSAADTWIAWQLSLLRLALNASKARLLPSASCWVDSRQTDTFCSSSYHFHLHLSDPDSGRLLWLSVPRLHLMANDKRQKLYGIGDQCLPWSVWQSLAKITSFTALRSVTFLTNFFCAFSSFHKVFFTGKLTQFEPT